jgi:nicotinamidase-related amidase
MRPRRPVLDHAALLVIDMQEYFRSIAEPVLPSVAALLGRLRERGVPVLFTQHGHDEPAQDGGMLFEWWDEHILVGTPEWQLLSEIAPREGRFLEPTSPTACAPAGSRISSLRVS